MRKIIKSPWLWLALLILAGYLCAEILIRGEALNRVSGGIAGWLLWGGVALLIFCWVIHPILNFSLCPEWKAPEKIEDPIEQINFLDRYGHYLLSHFGKKPPESLAKDLDAVRDVFSAHGSDPAARAEKFLELLPRIHDNLSEDLVRDIIDGYMKKAGLMVCISQRGKLDSCVLFYLQFRMLLDLSKALGYRPNWYFVVNFMIWIAANSFLFSLFDETEVLEEAFEQLLPYSTAGALGNSIPIVGKVISSGLQGFMAMGVVWVTGKIITDRLLGKTKKLSLKELVTYRKEGYGKAIKVLGQSITGKVPA